MGQSGDGTRLASLGWQAVAAVQNAGAGPAAGEVRSVIDRLLGATGEPMHAREIHRAVERDLGEEVPWSSIANCLRRNAAGDHGRFEKVGLGMYRRRENPSSGSVGDA